MPWPSENPFREVNMNMQGTPVEWTCSKCEIRQRLFNGGVCVVNGCSGGVYSSRFEVTEPERYPIMTKRFPVDKEQKPSMMRLHPDGSLTVDGADGSSFKMGPGSSTWRDDRQAGERAVHPLHIAFTSPEAFAETMFATDPEVLAIAEARAEGRPERVEEMIAKAWAIDKDPERGLRRQYEERAKAHWGREEKRLAVKRVVAADVAQGDKKP